MRALGLGVAVSAVLAAISQAQVPAYTPTLRAVGLESQYANIMVQIGGPYVQVSSIESNPNSDPHEFEVSPAVAQQLGGADVILANGLGYDAWADDFLTGSKATILSAQSLLGLPDATPNPHLWYSPAGMVVVARAVAAAFAARDSAHASVYAANEKQFEAGLRPSMQALALIKQLYAGTRVAVTEPVADELLRAAGLSIVTPFGLEAAVMNGTDPAPQDVTAQEALLNPGGVAILVYNQQVTDSLTQDFLSLAKVNHIPTLGVYELMPPGAGTYQGWMLQTVNELRLALQAPKGQVQPAPINHLQGVPGL